MDLAKQLGAEIVRLNGDDIASTIAEYAKISGITNIVIEKTRNKKSLKRLFETDVEDKIISMLPNVEIHIIPGIPQKPYRKERRLKITDNLYLSWFDALKTMGILLATVLISIGLRTADIGEQNIIMLFILSILVISRITTGHLYGMIASILSVLLFNFFLQCPIIPFIRYRRDIPSLLLLCYL